MSLMWKVLIADDEPIIREGIRSSVDWAGIGMQVVAEAEDGEEALELAVRHGVDLLLVDLNMPIMNGLTLIKHLRSELPDCKVVIITGHDEFSYAQEAIRLEVNDYILKPANPDQLIKVMERIRLELEANRQQSMRLEIASKQLAKNLPLLRERFCVEWIQGSLTDEEIEEQLLFLKLPPDCPKQLCVVRWPELSASQPLLKENDRQLFLFAIENIVSELLDAYPKAVFRDHTDLIVICLWEQVPESVLHDMESAIQVYLKIPVYVHADVIDGRLTDIAEAYLKCKSAVYKETEISPLARRARQYIREHYTDPELTLEETAQALQVSPVYLSRILKQELGTSFVGLVTSTRMKRAVQLLNATDLTIHDIAQKVGYDTQHYFSTAFKKTMGVSPNQYRKGSIF